MPRRIPAAASTFAGGHQPVAGDLLVPDHEQARPEQSPGRAARDGQREHAEEGGAPRIAARPPGPARGPARAWTGLSRRRQLPSGRGGGGFRRRPLLACRARARGRRPGREVRRTGSGTGPAAAVSAPACGHRVPARSARLTTPGAGGRPRPGARRDRLPGRPGRDARRRRAPRPRSRPSGRGRPAGHGARARPARAWHRADRPRPVRAAGRARQSLTCRPPRARATPRRSAGPAQSRRRRPSSGSCRPAWPGRPRRRARCRGRARTGPGRPAPRARSGPR